MRIAARSGALACLFGRSGLGSAFDAGRVHGLHRLEVANGVCSVALGDHNAVTGQATGTGDGLAIGINIVNKIAECWRAVVVDFVNFAWRFRFVWLVRCWVWVLWFLLVVHFGFLLVGLVLFLLVRQEK